MDFELYVEFLSEDETCDWIRAWTGNQAMDGTEYRVFGQDGAGCLFTAIVRGINGNR